MPGHEVGGVADEVECGEVAMCDGERRVSCRLPSGPIILYMLFPIRLCNTVATCTSIVQAMTAGD